MASSLFTNTLHVCFDSVLAMDNPGSQYYSWETGEISEELFSSTFELPVDGLTDLSEIPKDIVFDARSIFSFSGEQLSTSCKKREMKFEFRLLSDILAKTISVKAGSFDAVTQERFFMMAAITCGVAINSNRLLFNILKDMNVPNLELGDSSEFPSSKILTKKTIHRYLTVNDKVGVEEVADVPRVKKTPVKRAVSKKRPAAVDETMMKKKQTRVGKDAAVATDSALEAVPVQVVAPISTVPPPAPKGKIQKRKRRLELGSDDEIFGEPTTVAEEVAIENIVEEQMVETDVGRNNDSGPDVEDHEVKIADETELRFNLSYEEFHARQAEGMVELASDTEEEFVTEKVTTSEVDGQTETGSNVYLVETPSEQTELFQGTETATAAPNADKDISDDDSMTLEEILLTIPVDFPLPST
ncbi:heme-binding-like protein chloroplastic [Dorcoceras hygrometricum]|uniref:Heme-binding-like protein chloroplastic n=1 Tax=Dorcoceras hygrometricum TaxID=472368 RepID=A0A2Z6ZYH9_9LAMI|nr:heme-binding-like protein chloroplastic [Dorcoceras hygrometricum]